MGEDYVIEITNDTEGRIGIASEPVGDYVELTQQQKATISVNKTDNEPLNVHLKTEGDYTHLIIYSDGSFPVVLKK